MTVLTQVEGHVWLNRKRRISVRKYFEIYVESKVAQAWIEVQRVSDDQVYFRVNTDCTGGEDAAIIYDKFVKALMMDCHQVDVKTTVRYL